MAKWIRKENGRIKFPVEGIYKRKNEIKKNERENEKKLDEKISEGRRAGMNNNDNIYFYKKKKGKKNGTWIRERRKLKKRKVKVKC